MEIDCLGIVDRGRIRRGGRKPGVSYRLWARSGICRVRKTAALVNYIDRFARWSGGRIILRRLRHRTPADDWFRTFLVGTNSADYFFAWPLIRRRRKYSHRVRGGYNLDGILFVAS